MDGLPGIGVPDADTDKTNPVEFYKSRCGGLNSNLPHFLLNSDFQNK